MSGPLATLVRPEAESSPAVDGAAVGAAYREVRRHSLDLAAPLSAEDCQAQSMPDASPIKWHLAHTTWFFETFVLSEHAPGYRSARPAYRMLFNSYYNAVGDRHPRPQRGLLTRPALAEVLAYRDAVDAAMHEWLDTIYPVDPAHWSPLIALGLNHEQQHQELMVTDLKHLLSCNPLGPSYLAVTPHHRRPPVIAAGPAPSSRGRAGEPPRWVPYPGGVVGIGVDGARFAFDNEGPPHRVLLGAYELADRLVTCGDYLRFVEDGGYRRAEPWLSLGWDRVQAEGWSAPLYWQRAANGWLHFTLDGWQPLDPDAPVVHLSYFEADAYARWADARLPTEAEWEHAVLREAVSPRLDQVDEAVWQWTGSAYQPYPGFRASADAIGEYNGKFMCNQYVLRGGSFATPPGHTRPSYRNFFPPEARWQFTGLRLARDADRPGSRPRPD